MTGISHLAADLTGAGAGLSVAVGAGALLGNGLRASGATRFGAANAVTAVRTVLVAVVTGLVARALLSGEPASRLLVAVTVVALALDAVDGFVARRTGSATALGARFDGEVDAFLMLVLSALLVPVVGAWVLAIGLMRYAFLVATFVLPWTAQALPPRYSRKVVAAVQGVVLVVAAAGVLPGAATVAVLAAALALLTWSFWVDVAWLARRRTVPAPAREAVLTR
ncbi:CDP-alcohol phosphatidyltransferase family protein [Kineosporia sp. R_H_3]|uniref:CDP-alcohol phosphatidyltransferase family protein n=1 Tax=Kineosporia sp. R_H_3 TaxID=1961848 RepID=UPI000B4AA89F|nr:CDP-alcohol phosphatidyltransferase family protein [Kineosporia sp. R_H_3]